MASLRTTTARQGINFFCGLGVGHWVLTMLNRIAVRSKRIVINSPLIVYLRADLSNFNWIIVHYVYSYFKMWDLILLRSYFSSKKIMIIS